jgi:UDP-glucose 4-epimerase
MTRFLMTLDDSVELVLHALRTAVPGDVLVQKAPAATIRDVCNALASNLNVVPNIKIIGTRHGEKLYETLVSKEEMIRTVNHETHFQIKADQRDLYYEKYTNMGEPMIDEVEEYNSHNTVRLDLEQTKTLISKLKLEIAD